ncbi:hypothetical protein AEQU1_01540 [Aequorivita sp. CIP111184]|nr:hypothetical protein AEQU1_01540 [Aequorivita sp. CIP111184]
MHNEHYVFQINKALTNPFGEKANKVNWIVSDITEFETNMTFDVWHDRATFHFLTTTEQIKKYMKTARNSVNGFLTIGTFSKEWT